MRKILFASSEVHPLMKTGGLADVSASLPLALHEQGQDVRIVMPAYRACLMILGDVVGVATLKLEGYLLPVEILQSRLPNSDVVLWLVNSPDHFDRDGGPYSGLEGDDWPDNAARFALFSRAIAALAMNEAGLSWQPDVLHCNDWQTGLAPALIADEPNRPATLFTIHNLAYQGLYSRDEFDALDLAESFWDIESLEFYSQLSFMKGGLVFADKITTVSPSYALEICTVEYGCGLEGLLAYRSNNGRLSGILNGIDHDEWNPKVDRYITTPYTAKTLHKKADNKAALQQLFALPNEPDTFLLGFISRLVFQKGIDLTIAAVRQLLDDGMAVQLVCLGSGDRDYERDLQMLRAHFPDEVGVRIGYDEALSHQIEAGVDAFVMPSRFEPCGLNQLYSLRYGTLPIVRATGGLADSVEDADGLGGGTGFQFELATVKDMLIALKRAKALYQQPILWRQMQINAMIRDFSWQNSASDYLALYDELMA
ncbi:MAG: starch synthase [Methylophagaceae bacterium]